jgi:hypothetical protein
VVCDTAEEAVAFIDQLAPVVLLGVAVERKPRATKPRKTKTRKGPDRAEKNKRNAKARAAYLEKHPPKTTTTTSRLEALPTTVAKQPGPQSRARTSDAVIATLKRSPSPLTLDEIDTDLEKSGWPYRGKDRKGAIRATLSRLKTIGSVSTFVRGTGLEAMQMFRLERTNGDVTTPVEQALTEVPFTREERAEVEDSDQQMLGDEARAEAEGDPDAREF